MPRAVSLLVCLACALLASCSTSGATTPEGHRVALDLAEPDGRSLAAITQEEGEAEDLAVTRAVSLLRPGRHGLEPATSRV